MKHGPFHLLRPNPSCNDLRVRHIKKPLDFIVNIEHSYLAYTGGDTLLSREP